MSTMVTETSRLSTYSLKRGLYLQGAPSPALNGSGMRETCLCNALERASLKSDISLLQRASLKSENSPLQRASLKSENSFFQRASLKSEKSLFGSGLFHEKSELHSNNNNLSLERNGSATWTKDFPQSAESEKLLPPSSGYNETEKENLANT